jgi:hypothetical protein
MRLRAVTWISICMRGSDSPAEIIVAAGRTAPKYWRRHEDEIYGSLSLNLGFRGTVLAR